MGYCDILAKFLEMFPRFMEKIRFWHPGVDRNTIHVELAGGKRLQFSYWNENEWALTALNAVTRRI